MGSGEHCIEGQQVQGHPSAAASESPGHDVNEITAVTSVERGLLVLSTHSLGYRSVQNLRP